MKVFANESEVLQVGGLQVENRLDRVTLSGEVDLTADKEGLEHARALKKVLDAVVAKLETMDLPQQVTIKAPTKVGNPFA